MKMCIISKLITLKNMNTSDTNSIKLKQDNVVPERFHAQVLIQFLRREEWLNQDTVNSAIEHFSNTTDFLIFWHEVRAEILEKWDDKELLDGTNYLPENLAKTIRSRIANAIESIGLHASRNTTH